MSHLINEGPWATSFRKGLKMETWNLCFSGGPGNDRKGGVHCSCRSLLAPKLGEFSVVEVCHRSVQRTAIEVRS